MSFADVYDDTEADEVGFDAGDLAQVNAAKRRAGSLAKSDEETLKNLLAYRPGRAFIWHFLEDCHVFEVNHPVDHAMMAFREGERNVGLRLLAMVGAANAGAFAAMHREHAENAY